MCFCSSRITEAMTVDSEVIILGGSLFMPTESWTDGFIRKIIKI